MMKKEEGRRKKEEGRRKKEEGRRKTEDGRRKTVLTFNEGFNFRLPMPSLPEALFAPCPMQANSRCPLCPILNLSCNFHKIRGK
jgi:hypothetical protein